MVSAIINPVGLKCEYTVNPLGIDTLKPRLSWIIESDLRGQIQTAYQILVANSEKNLRENVVGMKYTHQ